jgi:hypothetical protein
VSDTIAAGWPARQTGGDMHKAIKRVLLYMLIMGTCTVIAINFTETRNQFIAVFGFGLVFGITAEILFWVHIVRVALNRRSHVDTGRQA